MVTGGAVLSCVLPLEPRDSVNGITFVPIVPLAGYIIIVIID